MGTTELEGLIDEATRREVEHVLAAKLKAHGLSDSFIERYGEDAIQKAWVEYLTAVEKGVRVERPVGFIIRAAFFRALDQLRVEAREASDVEVDALLESESDFQPDTEERALEILSARELHEAIRALGAEERQILVLHYFDQVSDRRGAELTYCSERTFRRRLKRALGKLAGQLGEAVPEPGSELALELGVAAWVSLRGARVALPGSAFDQALAILYEGPRDAARWLLGRVREPATSLFAGGGGERFGALASGPAGKVLGGCAGAAAICVLGGVIPVTGGGESEDHHQSAAPHPTSPRDPSARTLAQRPPSRPKVVPAAKPAGEVSAPEAPTGRPPSAPAPKSSDAANPAAGTPTVARSSGRLVEPDRKRHRHVTAKAERHQVKAQTSGIERVAEESSPEVTTESPPAAEAEPEATVEPTTVESSPDSNQSPPSQAPKQATTSGGGKAAAGAEAEAEQQFGAFK